MNLSKNLLGVNRYFMRFKEFLERPRSYSPVEVAALYFQSPEMSTTKICEITGLTRNKLYDVVHQFGPPNRLRANHHTVLNLANQGFSIDEIAKTTHYTTRNVRYILNKRPV